MNIVLQEESDASFEHESNSNMEINKSFQTSIFQYLYETSIRTTSKQSASFTSFGSHGFSNDQSINQLLTDISMAFLANIENIIRSNPQIVHQHLFFKSLEFKKFREERKTQAYVFKIKQLSDQVQNLTKVIEKQDKTVDVPKNVISETTKNGAVEARDTEYVRSLLQGNEDRFDLIISDMRDIQQCVKIGFEQLDMKISRMKKDAGNIDVEDLNFNEDSRIALEKELIDEEYHIETSPVIKSVPATKPNNPIVQVPDISDSEELQRSPPKRQVRPVKKRCIKGEPKDDYDMDYEDADADANVNEVGTTNESIENVPNIQLEKKHETLISLYNEWYYGGKNESVVALDLKYKNLWRADPSNYYRYFNRKLVIRYIEKHSGNLGRYGSLLAAEELRKSLGLGVPGFGKYVSREKLLS